MSQLAFTGGQASHNLSQRPCSSQLTEQHGNQLAPARHSLGMLLGFVFLYGLLEHSSRDESDNLSEDATYSNHGWVIPFPDGFSTSTVLGFAYPPLSPDPRTPHPGVFKTSRTAVIPITLVSRRRLQRFSLI